MGCIGSSGCGQAPCEPVSLLPRCFLVGNPCGCPTSPSHGLAPVEASSAILPPSRRCLFFFFSFLRGSSLISRRFVAVNRSALFQWFASIVVPLACPSWARGLQTDVYQWC